MLVADDDASIRTLLRTLLEVDGHTVVEAADGPAALALLDARCVDLALMDLQMPGLTGEQVLQAVARQGGDLSIPILVVSGAEPSRGTLGLRLGAHDFISKPFDPDELLARVQAAHRVSAALRAGQARRNVIAAQLSEAERLASTDELTGLANRRHLLRTLEQTADSAHRGHHPYGVILADVDGFKQINDLNGHRAGDELLQAVGLILARSLRVVDTPGRWGGDEFLIVLPDASSAAATHAAHRVRSALACASLPVPVTLTLGVASGMLPPHEMVDIADRALLRGKQAGRDRVQAGHPV